MRLKGKYSQKSDRISSIGNSVMIEKMLLKQNYINFLNICGICKGVILRPTSALPDLWYRRRMSNPTALLATANSIRPKPIKAQGPMVYIHP